MKKQILLLIFLLFIISSLFAFYQYQKTIQVIDHRVELFLTSVNQGNLKEAQNLLSEEEKAKNSLEFLITETKINLEQVSNPKLIGLRTAQIDLALIVGEINLPLTVTVKKEKNNWLIYDLPEFQVYPQVLVLDLDAKDDITTASFLYDGKHKEISVANDLSPENQLNKGEAYFLVSYKNNLLYKRDLEKLTLSKVLSVRDGKLEGETEGLLPLSENAHLYNLTEERPRFKELNKLLVGSEDVHLFLDEGQIRLIAVTKALDLENIRIALNTNDFASLHHNRLELSSAGGLEIIDKIEETTYTFSPGEIISLNVKREQIGLKSSGGQEIEFTNRIHIKPLGNQGITTQNIYRGHGTPFTPTYRGNLEISYQKGSLLVVNELPLEEYLYSVVASEMPQSFGLEALKVQSMAARSYSVAGIYRNLYQAYGAHLEDSVRSQVFNNVKEQPLSTEAVQATKGLVALYDEEIIETKYFSTSAGYTASSHEVWSNPTNIEFPGEPIPYLRAKSQVPGKDYDLSSESKVNEFIHAKNIDGFDQDSPWFRWKITMSGEELKASIEENLATRQKADPSFVLTKTKKGWEPLPIPEYPLGELNDLKIVSRGEGGNIIELEIIGSNGSYLIRKEYNIRFTLRPKQYLPQGKLIQLERADGSSIVNYSILPSTFVVMDIDKNGTEMQKITFHGGGNGHGVGMSQYGVRGMVHRGYDFKDIFKHYYPGTELVNIYQD